MKETINFFMRFLGSEDEINEINVNICKDCLEKIKWFTKDIINKGDKK